MRFSALCMQAVSMSAASPAWQDYVDYIDAIVLDGLKHACLNSLKNMLNQIVKSNMAAQVSTAHRYTVLFCNVEPYLVFNAIAFYKLSGSGYWMHLLVWGLT